MSIEEKLGAQGSWTIRFKTDDEGGIPKEVVQTLEYFGHVLILSPWVDTRAIADPLPLARYTGIVLERNFTDGAEISGPGLLNWLGDDEEKGRIPETIITFFGDTFADAIAKVLTPELVAGTIHSQAPKTMTGSIPALTATPRKNLDRVMTEFGTEYRITPQGFLDAGTETQLYPTSTAPTCIILPRQTDVGDDPVLHSVPLAEATQTNDRRSYATRVILAAEGEGSMLATAAANLSPASTYLDLHGNPINRKKIISESDTDAGLAPTRALAHLATAARLRRELTLSTADYDIEGDFKLGDTVWAYDELSDLEDSANEVAYRGRRYQPTKIRIVGYTYPITKEFGVYYRAKDGTITDLTKWVEFEEGPTQIEVGAFGRPLIGDPNEQLRGRILADASIPGIPVFGTITSQVFTDDNGIERCRVVVPWSTPANTDATAIVDGAYYEIGYQRAGAGAFDYRVIPWGINSNEFTEFPVGSNLSFIIQASDSANPPNRSGFSAPTVFVAAADSTPPGTPAASTNAGNPLAIQVIHGLTLAAGGNLPDDLHHLNVYIDTSAGFTPGPGNFVGPIMASKANLDLGIPVIGTFGIYDDDQRWVKVKAVDASGNESDPSAASTVTAELLDTGHYTLLSVTDAIIGSMAVSKLTAGDISAAVITITSAGKFRFGRTSSPFHHGYIDANGIFTFTGGSSAYTGGTPQLSLDIAAGTFTLAGGTITAPNINGGTVTGGVLRTAASGNRIELHAATLNEIHFFTGHISETEHGRINISNETVPTDERHGIDILSPITNNQSRSQLSIDSESGDGNLPAQISLVTDEIELGGKTTISGDVNVLGHKIHLFTADVDENSLFYSEGLGRVVLKSTDSIDFEVEAPSAFTPLRIDGSASAGEMCLWIAEANGTLRRAKHGAAGSGPSGVGRALYID